MKKNYMIVSYTDHSDADCSWIQAETECGTTIDVFFSSWNNPHYEVLVIGPNDDHRHYSGVEAKETYDAFFAAFQAAKAAKE